MKNPHQDVMRVLKETSRTFYIPVARLPERLQETVAAAYLCMRAIDEIEDHETLDADTKAILLRQVGLIMQSQTTVNDRVLFELQAAFKPFENVLPEVTLRVGEWALHPPSVIAPRIWDATAAMADRMAQWVERNWEVRTESDLDAYTYSVAGAVGLLLCDIWAWFDGSQIDRNSAISFGRGLQAVNILRNRDVDMQRQVDYYPRGWTREEMFRYARRNLETARAGVDTMPRDAFTYLVEIPLLLAEATLDVLEAGQEKLSRLQVLRIVRQAG
ncbi:MAG: phytoene/squalene synthase family protein [Anaerolineales bacterium]|nr:phytoene/squalene synthase family protein [Anaerolineales bacterium]